MTTEQVVAALGALAQESRLQVFRLLVQQGPEGMAAGQIGERLRIPPATLSFHLGQLRHAGLVTSQRRSRSIVYAANYGSMEELLRFLTDNCCQGACPPEVPMVRKLAVRRRES